jgi:hypothetical protein
VGVPLLHQIEQPARGRHDDVDVAPQRLDLMVLCDAAEHDRALAREVDAVAGEVFRDLRGQLAGGRQHEDAGTATGPARLARQTVQDRQRERRRLAGAGLRATEDVAARRAGCGIACAWIGVG